MVLEYANLAIEGGSHDRVDFTLEQDSLRRDDRHLEHDQPWAS
jgi:hypothetical protein